MLFASLAIQYAKNKKLFCLLDFKNNKSLPIRIQPNNKEIKITNNYKQFFSED